MHTLLLTTQRAEQRAPERKALAGLVQVQAAAVPSVRARLLEPPHRVVGVLLSDQEFAQSLEVGLAVIRLPARPRRFHGVDVDRLQIVLRSSTGR